MNTKPYSQLWRESNQSIGYPVLRPGDPVREGSGVATIVSIQGATVLTSTGVQTLLDVVPVNARRGNVFPYPPNRPTTADF